MKLYHLLSIAAATLTASALADSPPAPNTQYPLPSAAPAIVSHIKVLSDKVEDVSSLEAWKKSFIRGGMTEEQKALAVWTTVVKFRQQTSPPNEFLESDGNVHDPIKDFNVYGYGMCCCASANIEALARYAGLDSRGWGINRHCVPEIKIDGKWGLLDASLINYFVLPNGKIAGVEEINASVMKWLDENPDYKKITDHNDFYKIMRKGAWKKIGPEVLKGSATYNDDGWQPAHTHAWGDTIMEYGGTYIIDPYSRKPGLIEYGTAVGYEVNIQLRPGEKLIRNWSNKGLDVRQPENKPAPILTANPQNPAQDMRYAPKYGDLTDGRAGNGTLEYTPPLESLQSTALTCENLTFADNTLRVADPTRPATLIIRMPSSYVYLDGLLVVGPLGKEPKVSISDNNGLDWKPMPGGIEALGRLEYTLKSFIYRRYDYRLKFEFDGSGSGLSFLSLTHDIMESQRVLPILDQGDTKISFSSGAQEGTITVCGNMMGVGNKNVNFSDYHPVLENIDASRLAVQKGTGVATIPITTPGDLTRLRLGVFYRAVTDAEKYSVEASFDNGKTFAPIVTLEGPNRGNSKYVVFDKVPANTRFALIRLTGTAHAPDNLFIQDLRIGADYKEPHGGFVPVKVTYDWEENGQAKSDMHIAKSADESYTIHCDTKPKMKAITLELAQ